MPSPFQNCSSLAIGSNVAITKEKVPGAVSGRSSSPPRIYLVRLDATYSSSFRLPCFAFLPPFLFLADLQRSQLLGHFSHTAVFSSPTGGVEKTLPNLDVQSSTRS